MTYGSNLPVFGFYTIKTPLTSPSSVHFLCKCFLSFLYSSSLLRLCYFLIPTFYFLSCRMKVKECKQKGIYNFGFMDSNVIHENSIKKWPNRIKNNIFKALDKQHAYSYCRTTSSESFDFFSSLQFDNKYISNISSIYVYQQLPLDLALYRDRSGLSCCV